MINTSNEVKCQLLWEFCIYNFSRSILGRVGIIVNIRNECLFFLGSWGMNRIPEQTNRPRTASRLTRFVCPALCVSRNRYFCNGSFSHFPMILKFSIGDFLSLYSDITIKVCSNFHVYTIRGVREIRDFNFQVRRLHVRVRVLIIVCALVPTIAKKWHDNL